MFGVDYLPPSEAAQLMRERDYAKGEAARLRQALNLAMAAVETLAEVAHKNGVWGVDSTLKQLRAQVKDLER